MHIREYVALRMAELQYMQAQFEGYNQEDPVSWPLAQPEGDWREQDAAWNNPGPDYVHPNQQ